MPGPVVYTYSRITKSSATLIDNIYISNTMTAGLLHVNISDHRGIFCIDNNTLLSKENVLRS